MKVAFTPKFLRLLKKLPLGLQEEAVEKIELFKNTNNHKILKVRKLRGSLNGFYGFSINFQYRIIFEYISDGEAVLLAIGDHNIYEK